MAGNACPVCLGNVVRPVCPAVLYPGCIKDICGCPDCGAAFFYPGPTPEEIALGRPQVRCGDLFKRYWQDYYKGRALALRLSRWRTSGDLLDAGCGLGTVLAGLRDHANWRVRGLEASAEAAELGRGLNGVDIAGCPLSEAPYPAASLDCMLMEDVLEHEGAPRAAMANAARMLRPGGRLELIVPNGPVELLPDRVLSRKREDPAPLRHAGHLSFFSRRSLLGLLADFKLRALSLRGFSLKLGLQARGWLPGACGAFTRAPASGSAVLSLDQGRAMIPPQPSWALYALRDRMERFWRFSGTELGFYFEVIAEKV
jgi:SAM-dependent methyltransferase